MTYQPPPGRGPLPPPPQFGPPQFGTPHFGPPKPPKRSHGWYLVLAAAVLGVFVFCGIVVAATGGGDKPTETKDVSRNGALPLPGTTEATPAPAAAPSSAAAGIPAATTAPPATTNAPATTAPAPAKTTQTKKPATTRPPTTKPAAKPPAANCNPNYTPCVPNDPVDVDCAGGSGNGPSYVQGPVHVIGSDPYKLDTDNDGIGCE